jgi:hypothetical protein
VGPEVKEIRIIEKCKVCGEQVHKYLQVKKYKWHQFDEIHPRKKFHIHRYQYVDAWEMDDILREYFNPREYEKVVGWMQVVNTKKTRRRLRSKWEKA